VILRCSPAAIVSSCSRSFGIVVQGASVSRERFAGCTHNENVSEFLFVFPVSRSELPHDFIRRRLNSRLFIFRLLGCRSKFFLESIKIAYLRMVPEGVLPYRRLKGLPDCIGCCQEIFTRAKRTSVGHLSDPLSRPAAFLEFNISSLEGEAIDLLRNHRRGE